MTARTGSGGRSFLVLPLVPIETNDHGRSAVVRPDQVPIEDHANVLQVVPLVDAISPSTALRTNDTGPVC